MIRLTVLFDLDGTLADTRHRDGQIKKDMREGDWVAYSLDCADDKPIEGAIKLTDLLDRAGYEIIIVTGRHEQARHLTVRWLNQNHVSYDQLIMRQPGDVRDSVALKVGHVRSLRAQGKKIVFAIDDFEPNAEALDSLRVPCLLVAHNGHGRKKDEKIHEHTS